MEPSDHAMNLLGELADSARPVHLVFLLVHISAHLEEIRQAAAKNELLPVDIAQAIAERLRVLEPPALGSAQPLFALGGIGHGGA